MNTKIQKANREIENARARIAELQALLPELEKQKTDLENTEIVRLVRSAKIDLNVLNAFLQTIPEKVIAPKALPNRDSIKEDSTDA